MKKLLKIATALLLTAALAFTFAACGEKPEPTEPAKEIAVTLSIDCSNIEDKSPENIPDNGVILPETKFLVVEGSTVYDLLMAAAEFGIGTSVTDGVYGMFVTGIDSVVAEDYGPNAGWLFTVNGKDPGKSCSDCVLNEGDSVMWYLITSADQYIQ